MDTALIPDRLFAALNLIYEPEVRLYSSRAVERESNVAVAAAISARVIDQVFIGGELRHVTKYQDYFLGELQGRALFAGPTVYVAFGENAYAGMAWSVQVSGRAADGPNRSLDVINFERHQVRLKMGFTF